MARKIKKKTQSKLRKLAGMGLFMAALKGAVTAAGGMALKKVWI